MIFCETDFFKGEAAGDTLALGLIRKVLFIVGVKWHFRSLATLSLLTVIPTPSYLAEGNGRLSEWLLSSFLLIGLCNTLCLLSTFAFYLTGSWYIEVGLAVRLFLARVTVVFSSISLRSIALCRGLGFCCFEYFLAFKGSTRFAFRIGRYRSFRRRYV